MFDVCDRETYTHVLSWLSEIEMYADMGELCILLVGNKVDQKDRDVTTQEAKVTSFTLMWHACAFMNPISSTLTRYTVLLHVPPLVLGELDCILTVFHFRPSRRRRGWCTWRLRPRVMWPWRTCSAPLQA